MTSAEQLPFPESAPGDELRALSFETLLARLESTISLLAEGSAPLDELVAAHQLAAGLLAEAERRLESLKARADELVAALKT
ncbi:MAG TPA: exodeoxyribonuclease VII small subunit [Candidatus Acidoferrum sp.]|jgi:exodeoxyribonuclease VII small subunit|nr:exodeoxyribonuclease VII small subunit [Candidatus Acidoferrum sp.]